MAVCKKCEERGISFIQYNERHDAYYCGICDEWLESNCGDPDCYYCHSRPEKPSECKTF